MGTELSRVLSECSLLQGSAPSVPLGDLVKVGVKVTVGHGERAGLRTVAIPQRLKLLAQQAHMRDGKRICATVPNRSCKAEVRNQDGFCKPGWPRETSSLPGPHWSRWTYLAAQ